MRSRACTRAVRSCIHFTTGVETTRAAVWVAISAILDRRLSMRATIWGLRIKRLAAVEGEFELNPAVI